MKKEPKIIVNEYTVWDPSKYEGELWTDKELREFFGKDWRDWKKWLNK
jgi:hypothetical protein